MAAASSNFFTTASHPYAEHRASRKEKADLAAIDKLVSSSGCTAAYIDIGSNIGVQLRKLVEPTRYRGALAVQIYDDTFGPSERVDRCRVCAIGFEPNPRHARRLDQLEAAYKAAGAPVLVLRGAASTFSGEEQFFLHKNATLDTGAHTGFIHPRKMHERCQKIGSGCQDEIYSQMEMATVRAIDLARILEHLRAALARTTTRKTSSTTRTTRLPPPPPVIVAKMDIEAGEYELLPHLLESNALCGVRHLLLEWHPHVRGWEGDCERGEQGTWPLRRYPHLNSLDACVARCKQCSRCRYISFMAARPGADLQTGDCSWYRCCDTATGTPNTRFPGFSTVQVRPWPAGGNLSFCAA